MGWSFCASGSAPLQAGGMAGSDIMVASVANGVGSVADYWGTGNVMPTLDSQQVL